MLNSMTQGSVQPIHPQTLPNTWESKYPKTLNGRKTNERILAFSRFQGWAITLKLSKRSCKGQRNVNSFLAGASLMAQELANTNVAWLLYLTSGSVDAIIGSMEQERALWLITAIVLPPWRKFTGSDWWAYHGPQSWNPVHPFSTAFLFSLKGERSSA